MASGRLNVDALISHATRSSSAVEAYDLLAPGSSTIAWHPAAVSGARRKRRRTGAAHCGLSSALAGLLRNGGREGQRRFSRGRQLRRPTLIPASWRPVRCCIPVVSSGGVSARSGAQSRLCIGLDRFRSGARRPGRGHVVVATRHDAHARQVPPRCKRANMVFCEKPLCLTLDELAESEAEARALPAQATDGRLQSPLRAAWRG